MENQTIAIAGSAELAIQLKNLACSCGSQISGFFDDFRKPGVNGDLNILGPLNDIPKFYSRGEFNRIVIGIGYKHMALRRSLLERIKQWNIPLANLVHPSATVDPSASIEDGSVIYAGVIIDQAATIKSNALINLGCILSHNCIVGENSFIAPGVVIAGYSKIGKQCFIGANATVIDNLEIPDDTTIGAGAVVTRTLINKGTYVGNPAKMLHRSSSL
jgi:sugar O-acyltransferase (sialic acid O-acetyltransferase NeuD family)